MPTILSYMKVDYLTNSKIKPKIWWQDRLQKEERRAIINQLAESSDEMKELLNTHKINLPDIFKYAVLEPVYLDNQLKPSKELHYLIVIYLPNQTTQYYIVK